MSKTFTYDTSASKACCKKIHITLEKEVIQEIHIEEGCEGNHRGLAALVKGQNARHVIKQLDGIDCDSRGTSCPDQLAKALRAALKP